MEAHDPTLLSLYRCSFHILPTLSMAKLPMKKKLPSVKVSANLCGLPNTIGSPTTNASTKKATDSNNDTTKPW